jgi:hypothetical protein
LKLSDYGTIYNFFTYKGSFRLLRISQEDGLNRKIAAVAAATAAVTAVVSLVVVATAVICPLPACQQV